MSLEFPLSDGSLVSPMLSPKITWRINSPETVNNGFDPDWHLGAKMQSKKRYNDRQKKATQMSFVDSKIVVTDNEAS